VISLFADCIRHFRRDQRGNIAVIFALTLMPILASVGCAVDYSRASQIRTGLQAATDSASIASIAQSSPGYAAAMIQPGNGAVTAAETDGNNVFDGNAGPSQVTGYTGLTRTTTVTKTGTTLTSNVTFSANVPVTFMKLLGFQNIAISGSSGSSATLPTYLDFYLMLDVSGSMGLPSTSGEQTRMAAVNPDNFVAYPTGCTLACHFAVQNVCTDGGQGYPTNNYCLGYAISRLSQIGYQNVLQTKTSNPMKQQLPSSMISGLPGSLNTDPTHGLPAVSSCPTAGTDACIQLRADAVGYALTQLFITANADEVVTNQFRIGLFPFIQTLYTSPSNPSSYYTSPSSPFPLTTVINGDPTNPSTINYAAANLASLLDTNTNTYLGSGGTHIDTALTDMNGVIPAPVGNGSSPTNTQPFIFLITDGAQDPQTKTLNSSGGWAGSNHATVIDPTQQCQTIKNRGIIISVLYIPYQTIQNPNASFAGNEDGYANANIPSISPSLETASPSAQGTPPTVQGCASPGFFFTANTPADITTALNAMFQHSLQSAHMTN
jgi:Flp pilus assembly protein TadG